MPLKDQEKVGEVTRGDLFRDLLLIANLLELANNAMVPSKDGGVSAATEIAQRMADDLAEKVAP